MRKIKSIGVWLTVVAITIMAAPDVIAQGGIGKADDIGVPKFDAATVAARIQSTLIFIAAILAVIFVAIGGIRYASSNGNPAQIEGAKKTITYALIGLLLAILAAALVGFVIGRGPQ